MKPPAVPRRSIARVSPAAVVAVIAGPCQESSRPYGCQAARFVIHGNRLQGRLDRMENSAVMAGSDFLPVSGCGRGDCGRGITARSVCDATSELDGGPSAANQKWRSWYSAAPRQGGRFHGDPPPGQLHLDFPRRCHPFASGMPNHESSNARDAALVATWGEPAQRRARGFATITLVTPTTVPSPRRSTACSKPK
jgi:hypothetical protein